MFKKHPDEKAGYDTEVGSNVASEGGMYRLQWSWDLKMCPY